MNYTCISQILNSDDEIKFDTLRGLIVSRKNLLTSFLNEKDFKKLDETIEKDKNLLAFINTKKITENNVDFILGTYIGFLQAMEEITDIEIKKESTTKAVKEIGYGIVKKILDMLIDRKYGLIETDVNIEGTDKDILENIMYILFKENMITYTRPGNYKFYYITEFGKKYYNEYFTINKQEETDNES